MGGGPLSDSNLPVRVVEAEWDHDFQRETNRFASLVETQHGRLFGILSMGLLAWVFAMAGYLNVLAVFCLTILAIELSHVWNKLRARRFIMRNRRPPDPDAPFSSGTAIIRLARGRTAYAFDVGLVVVDDHYFHFEGAQTTFSIAGDRMRRVAGHRIQLVDAPGYSIEVWDISIHGWTAKVAPASYFAYRAEQATPDASALGRIIALPPLAPIRRRFTGLRACALIVAAVAAVGIAWPSLFLSGVEWLFALLTLAALCAREGFRSMAIARVAAIHRRRKVT